MGKKLGPLTLVQWGLIGAAIGLFVLLRNRNAPAAAGVASPSTTPASTFGLNTASGQTDLGPTDPTSGLPYSFEFLQGQGSNGGTGGIATLEQELSDLATINSQLQALGLNGLTTSTATSSKTGTNSKTKKGHITKQEAIKALRAAGHTAHIRAAELEPEGGRLIWSFDLGSPGAKTITEVHVDANTGKVVGKAKREKASGGPESGGDKGGEKGGKGDTGKDTGESGG